MTKGKPRPSLAEVKALLAEDRDFLRPLVEAVLQELLEAEMSEALGAEKGERTPGRLGYRSGYYDRTLVSRVGKLELRVPQDRHGRFSTVPYRYPQHLVETTTPPQLFQQPHPAAFSCCPVLPHPGARQGYVRHRQLAHIMIRWRSNTRSPTPSCTACDLFP